MAGGSAKIGALHVSMGIDTAQFSSGLAKAQSGLAGFGKAAGIGLAAVATAAAAATVAMGIAVKGAIDHADELGKVAQKVGVSVEALSRLEYAAKLSDISLETLSGGLKKLSQNLASVAQGSTGPAATAFAALGISVTDTNGVLRASDQVLADVAEKFARLEDGSTKTALAVQLFGKSGAELIPLLNEGKDGLANLSAEADRLGVTLSSDATRGAEEFNDTLTRIGASMQGVTNRVMVSTLPGLQKLADKLASPEFAQAAATLSSNVVGALNLITDAAVTAVNAMTRITKVGETVSPMGGKGAIAGKLRNEALGVDSAFDGVGAGATASDLQNFNPQMDETGMGAHFGQLLEFITPVVTETIKFTDATTGATEAEKALEQAMSEGMSVFEATRTPFESMQMELDSLGQLLNQGAIDWDTYGRAVNSVTMNAASTTLGALGQITGALAGAFEENKAFAVANAVINTAEGVTKALAQGGIFGFASAAAIGIAGAAQIASILSAKPGSSSKAATPTAAVPTPVAPASGGGGTAINLTLLGGGRYSRNELESLFRDMNDAMGDGFKLNVNPA